MIAVRLSAGSAVARNAERGATSMLCVEARRARNTREGARVGGMGIKERKMAEGKWVKTIV